MALTHSAHHATHRVAKPLTERRLHPAIGLAGGFGFIVGGALLVHYVFNALV